MDKKEKEIRAPEPGGEQTPENQPEKESPEKPKEEKTSEQEKIKSLQAQKEHWREKAEKAEEEAARLKLERESSTSSEAELAKQHPDWEYLEPSEKERIKREIELDKRIRKLEEEKAWERDFGKAVKEFPKLASKRAEFKDFCYEDEHIGNKNIITLAKAFLFEEVSEPATPQVPRKGLEKPTGGRMIPPTGLSLEQIKALRTEQPKLYIKMVREGKIKKIPEE